MLKKIVFIISLFIITEVIAQSSDLPVYKDSKNDVEIRVKDSFTIE
ncbi:MAG: hypothetical protein ABFS12_07250 [Bacteroidota bacterium]